MSNVRSTSVRTMRACIETPIISDVRPLISIPVQLPDWMELIEYRHICRRGIVVAVREENEAICMLENSMVYVMNINSVVFVVDYEKE